MSARIFLLLGESPDASLTWLRVSHEGAMMARGESKNYADFAIHVDWNGTDPIIGLLPGELIAYRLLPTPPRGRAQFLSAANYLLEDTLAEDIDNLHVAIARREISGAGQKERQQQGRKQEGQRQEGQRQEGRRQEGMCIAISDAIMKRWHESFVDNALFPDILTADFLALPITAPTTTPITTHAPAVLAADDTHNDDETGISETYAQASHLTVFIHQDGLLAHGARGGMAMDKETAILVFDQVIEEWAPHSLTLYAEGIPEGWNNATHLTLVDNADLTRLGGLLHQGTENKTVIPNLLSGTYGKKVDMFASLKPWRGVGIAASLALVTLFGSWIADGLRQSREADRLASLSQEIHEKAFPSAAGRDPVQHARTVLNQQGSSADFLGLWVRFADAVEKDDSIQIDRFEYIEATGTARVSLQLDSIEQLTTLKAALAENGVKANERQMNKNNNTNKFIGDLTVEL